MQKSAAMNEYMYKCINERMNVNEVHLAGQDIDSINGSALYSAETTATKKTQLPLEMTLRTLGRTRHWQNDRKCVVQSDLLARENLSIFVV
jgi:hypothetical protein